MLVGAGKGEVSQRRRAKGIPVFRAIVGGGQSGVVGHAHDMQFVIGEHGPVVALDAPDLLEALHSADLFLRHGAAVAAHVAVERRVIGQQRALERRYRPA